MSVRSLKKYFPTVPAVQSEFDDPKPFEGRFMAWVENHIEPDADEQLQRTLERWYDRRLPHGNRS